MCLIFSLWELSSLMQPSTAFFLPSVDIFSYLMLLSSMIVLHLGQNNSMQQHKWVLAVAYQVDSCFAGKDQEFLRTASLTPVKVCPCCKNTGLYQQKYSQTLKAVNYSPLFGTYETTAGHCVWYWPTLLRNKHWQANRSREEPWR